mgnify:CR=1 FL=1
MSQVLLRNPTKLRTRVAGLLVIVGLAISNHADAQEPILVPSAPSWTSNAANQSMTLWLTTAKVGLGLTSPEARLHVQGTEILQEPGAGYLVLGTTDALHMQLDRNEIRVAGPSAQTVGTLYLQRFGGPISIRSSQEVSRHVSLPDEGGLAVGTDDIYGFAIGEGFWDASFVKANTAFGVDGDAFIQRVFADEGRFHKRLRVGVRGDGVSGGAWDKLHQDAVAMIGGALTAHEIIVHIDGWADDVFDEDYDLTTLEETQAYIAEHHHLPDVPPASEVLESGLNVGEMNALLLRKVEELTLHAIDQQAQIDALKAKIDACD